MLSIIFCYLITIWQIVHGMACIDVVEAINYAIMLRIFFFFGIQWNLKIDLLTPKSFIRHFRESPTSIKVELFFCLFWTPCMVNAPTFRYPFCQTITSIDIYIPRARRRIEIFNFQPDQKSRSTSRIDSDPLIGSRLIFARNGDRM